MSAPGGLSSFPLELLRNISSNLHPQDIKAFRTTSFRMHTATSPYLIPRAYIAFRPKTIAVFNEIIAHPVFSQNVKEIVFDSSQFLNNHAHSEYLYGEDHQRRHVLDKKCMPEYEHLYEMEQHIRSSNQFLQSLSQASRKLCQLDSFAYSDWQTICQESQSEWYLTAGPMSWDVRGACLPTVYDALEAPAQVALDEIMSALSSGQYLAKKFCLGFPVDTRPRLEQLIAKSLKDADKSSRMSKELVMFKAK